jgi:hypothetical protein
MSLASRLGRPFVSRYREGRPRAGDLLQDFLAESWESLKDLQV